MGSVDKDKMNNVGAHLILYWIIQDSIFMNYLSLLKWSPKRYLSIITPDVIFDRFSMHIFSAVQKKIEKKKQLKIFSLINLSCRIELFWWKHLMISISIFHLVFFQDQMRELLVTDDFQKTKNHYSTLNTSSITYLMCLKEKISRWISLVKLFSYWI